MCSSDLGQVGHMEVTTTTTPTSHERDYNGTHMGVDDAMIPLVDMMTCDCLHDVDVSFDVTYASFVFPCDTLFQTNVDHVEFPMYDENPSLDMMVPIMEKMYMEDENDATPWSHQDVQVGHMDAATSSAGSFACDDSGLLDV